MLQDFERDDERELAGREGKRVDRSLDEFRAAVSAPMASKDRRRHVETDEARPRQHCGDLTRQHALAAACIEDAFRCHRPDVSADLGAKPPHEEANGWVLRSVFVVDIPDRAHG